MFCLNCGTKVDKEDVFCPECGAKLRDDYEPGQRVIPIDDKPISKKTKSFIKSENLLFSFRCL